MTKQKELESDILDNSAWICGLAVAIVVCFVISICWGYSNDEIDEKIRTKSIDWEETFIPNNEQDKIQNQILDELIRRTIFADVDTEGCELKIKPATYSICVCSISGCSGCNEIGTPTQFILTCNEETKIIR